VLLSILSGCIGQPEGIGPRESVVPLHKEEASEVFESSMETERISLDFETYNGYTEVHLWDEEGFKIEVTKYARGETKEQAKTILEDVQADLSQESRGETTTVTLKVEYTGEKQVDTGADVKAYLPRKAFDIIELTSSNGYIRVEEVIASDVSLESSNGFVEASITADNIWIKTSNGGVKGFFQGKTVNIETSNGEIDIECRDSGRYIVETSNADIVITVGGDFSFDLETSNGDIHVGAGGVTYTVDSRTHKKGSTAGEPGVSITASTSNASITVTKK